MRAALSKRGRVSYEPCTVMPTPRPSQLRADRGFDLERSLQQPQSVLGGQRSGDVADGVGCDGSEAPR